MKDRIAPDLRVLFVGINPGVRSAQTGHHFAGFSNRFWKLLHESGLVPEPITFLDDDRLIEWGYGITNLIARPTPGINDLRPAEYVAGWTRLDRKLRRVRPRIVALVGVTVYRAIRPLFPSITPLPRQHPIELGLQPETIRGATSVRASEPEWEECQFLVSGNARRVYRSAACVEPE